MASISCSNTDKERFDDLLESESQKSDTHKEFVAELLDCYENRDEKIIIDTDEIIDEIAHTIGTTVELHAYRGIKDALESTSKVEE